MLIHAIGNRVRVSDEPEVDPLAHWLKDSTACIAVLRPLGH